MKITILKNHYVYLQDTFTQRNGRWVTVSAPALSGGVTYGEDVDDAIAMAKEAIELYIVELRGKGETLPFQQSPLDFFFNLCLDQTLICMTKVM